MNSRRVVVLTVGLAMVALPLSSAIAQQPPPNSPDVEGHNPNITYRDKAGDVHVVRFQDQSNPDTRSGTGDFDISKPSWPKATGTPTGYSSTINPALPEEHVIYRAANGHLIELWKPVFQTTWHKTDLMTAAGTKVRAAGDAVGWSHDTLGRQWIVYRAVGGQIHALTWLKRTNHWKDVNLSAMAHTKALAAADPTVYIDSVTPTARPVVVYRGTDKHVHLLVWTVGASSLTWHDSDISALSHYKGVPLSKPYGWASEFNATTTFELHAVFRTADGHVQELYGGYGQPWKHNDLTAAAKTTVHAVGDVQGTVGSNEFSDNFEGVQFKGDGGNLEELQFAVSVPTPWQIQDQGASVTRVGLWFQDGFNSYTVYLDGTHLWVVEYEWFGEDTDKIDLTDQFSATTHPATSTGGYFTPAPAH